MLRICPQININTFNCIKHTIRINNKFNNTHLTHVALTTQHCQESELKRISQYGFVCMHYSYFFYI